MKPATEQLGGEVAPHEALEPWDAFNRRLAQNVHPAGWVNPRPSDRYHLVVIGGGTAGLVTTAIAVALGARVALVERALLGGDCLNVGCVPSKALIEEGRAFAQRTGAGGEGGADFVAALERMRRIRAEISEHDSAERFRGLGADVFLGDATFTGPDTVQVGDAVLRFRRAVVATGTSPAIPSVPGLRESGYFTNETIFSLPARPNRLAVVGGGPIGCELAQAFAAFGTRVTLLEGSDRLLPADDPEASAVVARALAREGVEVVREAIVEEVRAGSLRSRSPDGPLEVEFDALLVAAGRVPNVEGLGLAAAGVAYDRDTGIRVDERLCTANPRIYAIGDVASPMRFTHVADAHARMVVRNALFFGRQKVNDLVIPRCTYTTPELAHVGPSFDDLSTRDDVESLTVPFSSVDRARLDGDEEGFLRVHHEKNGDRIVAATIVGVGAGELISQLTQAITAGVGLGKLADTIFPYPTRAEIIRKAGDAWRRRRLTPRAERAFGLYFRALR